MKRTRRPPMSRLEERVMEIVWARGACTVDELIDALRGRRRLRDSTARTLLSRLEEKGYVRHKASGRKNVYVPRVAKGREAMRRLRDLADRFWGGSVERMLVGMVEGEAIGRDDLRRLVDRLEAAGGPDDPDDERDERDRQDPRTPRGHRDPRARRRRRRERKES